MKEDDEPYLAPDPRSFVEELPDYVSDIEQVVARAINRQQKRTTPLHRPKSYLSRLVYELVEFSVTYELESELRAFLEEKIKRRGGRITRNMNRIGSNDLFHLCFRALSITRLPIKSGELTRLSRGLRHAAYEDVPSKYLIGYLYQTANARDVPLTPNEVLAEESQERTVGSSDEDEGRVDEEGSQLHGTASYFDSSELDDLDSWDDDIDECFVSNYDLTAFPPDLQRERLAKNREVEPGSDDDGWDDYDSS